MGFAAASTSASQILTLDFPSDLVSLSVSPLLHKFQPALSPSSSRVDKVSFLRSFTFSPIVRPEVQKRTLGSSGLIGPNSTLTVSPIQDVDDELTPYSA